MKVSFISNFKVLFGIGLSFLPGLLCIGLLDHLTNKAIKSTSGWYWNEWNDVFNGKLDASIWIQGNSRAWVQIDPCILEEITGEKAYNLGIDAYSIDIQLARGRSALIYNPSPELIIQNVDPFTFRNSKFVNWDYEQFLPYLNEPELRSVLIQNQLPWEERFLPFLRYRGRPELIEKKLTQYFNSESDSIWEGKHRGYAAQDLHWSDDFRKFQKDNSHIESALEPSTLKDFDQFIQQCLTHKCKILLVFQPMYHEAVDMIIDKVRFDSVMRAYTMKYQGQVYYSDHSKSQISFDTSNFYNATHLNRRGSELFSRIMALETQQILFPE